MSLLLGGDLLFAIDFEYAGEKLSDYGFIICNFNGSGLETVSSGADVIFNQVKPAQSNYFFSEISASYEQPFISQPFQICKNPCLVDDDNNFEVTPIEVSAIQRWLCRKNSFNKFKIIQEGYENIFWNAKFTCQQIMIGGRIVGLELTMYTDAPFGYMDAIEITENCIANSSFDVYDISDEDGYTYPDMTITLNDSGHFILYNNFNGEEIFRMSLLGCSSGEVITINGKNKIITSSNSDTSHTILARDFNYDFPKIANFYDCNKNTITTSLDCEIFLSYNPTIKVGL